MAGNPSGQARGGWLASNPTPLDVAAAAARVPKLRFPACDACGQPIERKGYARVSIAAARDRARHRHRHRDEPPPPLIAWRFLHGACDPGVADADGYFVGVSASRTARRLLVEVLKLTAREWCSETAWRPMVATILAASRNAGADGS
jgi:hypothetical protein